MTPNGCSIARLTSLGTFVIPKFLKPFIIVRTSPFKRATAKAHFAVMVLICIKIFTLFGKFQSVALVANLLSPLH